MRGLRSVDAVVTLRESRLVTPGRDLPQIGGDYIAVVSGDRMIGVWESPGSSQGRFELQRTGRSAPA